ncbi:MAG: hypothetical protein INR72_16325 [Williamsia herbipolensis]|nr:hypothetical protein [Williamsia herbipolensis]
MKTSQVAPAFVLGGAVTLLLVGCATADAHDGSAPAASLQLRAVASQSSEPCDTPQSASPGPVADEACDAAGTTRYELGEPLGTITPSSVRLADSGASAKSIVLHLDEDDAATLASATRSARQHSMAILLDGTVVSAPRVMDTITTDDVTLTFDSTATAKRTYDRLRPSHDD